MPVNVIVSTVVVRSATARRRATEFCSPRATAVTAAIVSLAGLSKGVGAASEMSKATTTSSSSTPMASRRRLSRRLPNFSTKKPPPKAPMRNPARVNSEAAKEKPGAPEMANPTNTTFPVMFATKTRPKARMLTESTTPVTTVSPNRRSGMEPSFLLAANPSQTALACLRRGGTSVMGTFLSARRLRVAVPMLGQARPVAEATPARRASGSLAGTA